MNTVIFDMHGIIFSHSSMNDLNESGALFDKKVKEYSQKFNKYKTAWDELNQGNNSLALEIERKSILKGINDDKSELQIYEMPNSIKYLIKYYNEKDKIVIISTSEVETSKNILIFLFKKHGINLNNEIIDSIDIHNIDIFGGKKDPLSWEKIMKNYVYITEIYEDKPRNLEAAETAAKRLGHKPNLHSKI